MKAPLSLQFLLHMLVHAGKVDDIVGGITQLGFRQGTTRPVGEGIDLLERHAALGADQGAVADLLRVPQQRRRHLRVEQRLRKHAHLVPQDLKVLPAGVQHLHDAGILEKRRQHMQVLHAKRVDHRHLVVGGELDQAQARIIGLLA